jgi:hypothetical protein
MIELLWLALAAVVDIIVQLILPQKEVVLVAELLVGQDFIAMVKVLVMQVVEALKPLVGCEEIVPMVKMEVLVLEDKHLLLVAVTVVAAEAAGMVAVELTLQAAVEDRVMHYLLPLMLSIPKVFKRVMVRYLLHGRW